MDRLSWASAGNQPGARKRANVPERGESREIEKMKNSGNEAKEYLKTKDITFLNAIIYLTKALEVSYDGRTFKAASPKSSRLGMVHDSLHCCDV
jgi:hypothetical protein